MKKFIFGFIAGIAITLVVFFGFSLIQNMGFKPVSPDQLNPEAKEWGALRLEVFGKGQPISGVEVDLGKIGPNGPEGPMSAMETDANGVVLFEKIPVGTYDVFWNSNDFPQNFNQPGRILIEITKDQTTLKRIDFAPKQ